MWLSHDIRDAFGSIPRARLFDLLQWAPENMRDVIEGLVKTDSRRGIIQGSPLSPLLLNVYLDHCLDKTWRRSRPLTPFIRFADDLLILCKNTKGAKAADCLLRELLTPAGFQLKADADSAICDFLRHQSVDWLGFRFRMEDERLQASISEYGWQRLEAEIAGAVASSEPQCSLERVLRGWLDWFAMTHFFYDRNERIGILDRIEEVCESQGITPPSRHRIRNYWRTRAREKRQAGTLPRQAELHLTPRKKKKQVRKFKLRLVKPKPF
jgi:hypothetical protein